MTDTLPIRVRVQDVWDDVVLDLPSGTPLAEVKRRALSQARLGTANPDDYMVKYRGGEVLEERNSLAAEGVTRNGALIVMRRRRQPVQ